MRRGGRTQRHGTDDRYCAGKCRCELCRAAHTEAVAAWRHRQRVFAALKPTGGWAFDIDAAMARAAEAAVPYPRPRRFEDPLRRARVA